MADDLLRKMINPDVFIRNPERERQQIEEMEELESLSKQLYELVATENFTVDEVDGKYYSTSFTPHSEMRIGGKSPVYRGGFTSRLVLKVSPNNQDVPVRTINFDGFSIVRAGDYISAQIPRYQIKKVESGGLHSSGPYRPFNIKIFYLDRDFDAEESAIELAILSADGKVLRRDRAVNYNEFIK